MTVIYVKPVGRGNWRRIGIDVSAAPEIQWKPGMVISMGSKHYRVVA